MPLSLKSSACVFAIVAIIVGVPLVAFPAPAGADGGNSASAKLCQHGGYHSWVRANRTPFANVGDCVSYAAHGGTLTLPATAGERVCESLGGIFGNTNLIPDPPTIVSVLWTCNNVPVDDLNGTLDAYHALSTAGCSSPLLLVEFFHELPGPVDYTCGTVPPGF